MYNLTNEMKQKIPSIYLSDDEITVIKLRHARIHFINISKLLSDESFTKEIPSERLKEMENHINEVKETTDYDYLFSLLSKTKGSDAIDILIEKLLHLKPNVFEDIIDGLCDNYSEIFIDNALITLKKVFEKNDISEQILNLLKSNKIRDPLDFASLLMVLGQSRNENLLETLYSFYVFFKDNFPDEEYFEGPLLAMCDILSDD